ncbi:hypothetical protein HAP94_17590 [Acidithiobacillus ferrivorans]|nr:hypothetical protein [Acidithiobacillus ferrivorans]
MSKVNGVVVRRFGKVAAFIGGSSVLMFPLVSSATGLGLGISAATTTDAGLFQGTLTTTMTALAGALILVGLGILAVKWVTGLAKRG